MPRSRSGAADSLKKRIPTTAIKAAPPAKIIGTEDSAALLEQQEEEDSACADTYASEHRVKNTGSGRRLVPRSGEPEPCQVAENRQSGRGLNDKSAEAVADSVGGQFRENLMRAIKNGCAHRVIKPSRYRWISFRHGL